MHGPNGMEADFLNNLTRVSSLGPDLINDFAAAPKVSSPNSYLNDDLVTPFSMAANVSSPRAYIIHGPDVVEPNSASAYVIHGPVVFEPSIANPYLIDRPDTSEWAG